jgi:hypothetical protein
MQKILDQLLMAKFDAKLQGGKVLVALPGGSSLIIAEYEGMYMVADGNGDRTSVPCGSPEEVVDAVKGAARR